MTILLPELQFRFVMMISCSRTMISCTTILPVSLRKEPQSHIRCSLKLLPRVIRLQIQNTR